MTNCNIEILLDLFANPDGEAATQLYFLHFIDKQLGVIDTHKWCGIHMCYHRVYFPVEGGRFV
jgi:hypothetical protein